MMKRYDIVRWGCLFSFLLCGLAEAQTLQLTSKNWRTYTYGDAAGKQCYVASAPVKKAGNDKGRAEPFMLVTRIAPNKDEVSVSSGYPYREESDIVVLVDRAAYHLFAKADRAWTKDAATDKAMVARMKHAKTIMVKGVSAKGFHSQDSYSLAGFNAAYQKMSKLCR